MSINQVLTDYIKQQPVFFVGAGISFNSGIPTVYPLKKALLNGLGILSDKEIEEIASFDIPFESFISSLQSDCRSIKTLFDIYGLGKPNLNHYFLAHLGRLGFCKIIITTNFDTLIEQAFQQIENDKIKVYKTQHEIRNINFDFEGTILIKIHGCITSKRTIATTLNRVSNANSYDYRKKIVREVFGNSNLYNIISMGYSYSDAFDVTPAIDSCLDKNTEVYILGHEPKFNEIKGIDALEKSHPLKDFENTKKIAADFDSVVIGLWETFIKDSHQNINTVFDDEYKKKLEKQVNTIIQNWVSEVEREFKISAFHSMIAGIYIKVSRYDKVEYHFSRAISIAKEQFFFENILHYTSGLVMLFDNQGKYNDVIQLSQEMINLIEEVHEDDEFIFYEMIFLEYKGKAQQCNLNFNDAQITLDKALMMAKKLKNKNHTAFCMTLVATNLYNLNKFSEAISYFKDAEKKYIFIGDITGLSFNYSELAKLYIEQSDYKNALVQLFASLNISKKINNSANVATDLTEIGRVMLLNKKYKESESYFKKALEVYNNIDDKLGCAICINNYAFLKREQGDLNNAIKLHKKALIILKEFEFYPSLEMAYIGLAEAYKELKNHKKSHYFFSKADLIKSKIA